MSGRRAAGGSPRGRPFAEALALARRVVGVAGETPGALRELSVSLNRVGDGPREAGEPAAAHEVYNEALALDRWRIDLYGETPLAQRGLSVSLRKVAEIEEDLRNAAKAKAARAEAQSIAERLGS